MAVLLVWWKGEFKFHREWNQRVFFQIESKQVGLIFLSHLNWSCYAWAVQKLS